jgi:hypothetical protein
MSVTQQSLLIVCDRFPNRVNKIQALFNKKDSFQTLCEDYRRCADALQHWIQSLDENASMRVAEYRALLQELEEEIIQNLDESMNSRLSLVKQ